MRKFFSKSFSRSATARCLLSALLGSAAIVACPADAEANPISVTYQYISGQTGASSDHFQIGSPPVFDATTPTVNVNQYDGVDSSYRTTYTANGTATSFEWTSHMVQDGAYDVAVNTFGYFRFTANSDASFSVSNQWSGYGQPSAFNKNGATLYDGTTVAPFLINLLSDGTETAQLITGHDYIFNVVFNLISPNPGDENHDPTPPDALYSSVADGTVTVNLTDPASAVPEPSTFALLSLGGIGLAIRAYRRHRATAV